MLRLLPRHRERRRECAARYKRRWLGVEGRRWHVAPRMRTEGESPLAGGKLFHRTRADHNQRSTARARRKLECCSFSPETASAGASAPRDTSGAGLELKAAGGTLHHGRVPKERGSRLRSVLI